MNSSDELEALANDDDKEIKYINPNEIGTSEAIIAEINYFKSKQEEEKNKENDDFNDTDMTLSILEDRK